MWRHSTIVYRLTVAFVDQDEGYKEEDDQDDDDNDFPKHAKSKGGKKKGGTAAKLAALQQDIELSEQGNSSRNDDEALDKVTEQVQDLSFNAPATSDRIEEETNEISKQGNDLPVPAVPAKKKS